jgi:hypothetical protein
MNTNELMNTTAPVAPEVAPAPDMPRPAPTKGKGKAKGKGKGKGLVTAKAPSKAPKAVAAKVPSDPYVGPFKLKAWPKSAGPAPSRDQLIDAHALLGGKTATLGSKKLLAVAAYLRPTAVEYTTDAVAIALQAACIPGGSRDPKLNVFNHDLGCNGNIAAQHRLVDHVKTKVNGGTAYAAVLNKRGAAVVAKYRAARGLPARLTVCCGEAGCDEDGTGQAQRTDEADDGAGAALRNSVHEVPPG